MRYKMNYKIEFYFLPLININCTPDNSDLTQLTPPWQKCKYFIFSLLFSIKTFIAFGHHQKVLN